MSESIMIPKAPSIMMLLQELENATAGRLEEAQERILELQKSKDILGRELDKTRDEVDLLRSCTVNAQSTINSLASQLDHWKGECEKNATLKTRWFDRARAAEGLLSDLHGMLDKISPDGAPPQEEFEDFTMPGEEFER